MTSRLMQIGMTLLSVVALSAPLTASAESPRQINSAGIKVSFADLDIHSEAGAKVLYQRLKRASAAVCNVESYQHLGSLDRVRDADICFARTLGRSVEKVGSDTLREIHTS